MPIVYVSFSHTGDVNMPTPQDFTGAAGTFDNLVLSGFGNLTHTLTNDNLLSIDQVSLLDSSINGLRIVHLDASQFGLGILLTAKFLFDPFLITPKSLKSLWVARPFST